MHRLPTCFGLMAFILIPFLVKGQNAEYPWSISAGGSVINYAPHPGNPELHENLFDYGIQIGVHKYLNSAFEFRSNLLFAPSVRFPEGIITRTVSPLFDMNYQMAFKFNNGILLRESGLIGPYLAFGIGGSYTTGHPDAYIPLGGGVKFRLNPRMSINLETTRKISLNKDVQHLSHAIAFIYNMNTSGEDINLDPKEIEDLQQVAALLPQDTDKDGLIDSQDDCPEVAGTIGANGCPTEDFTSPDPLVEVVDEANPSQDIVLETQSETYSNAEIEVIDEQKVTPSVPADEAAIMNKNSAGAEIAFSEVPPQEDNLEETLLKTVPQPSYNNEVKDEILIDVNKQEAINEEVNCGTLADRKDLAPVKFPIGSDELDRDAYARLDEIADYLKKCDNSKLVLSGHTDDKGNEKDNMVLSVMRAFNVKYYLVNQHNISQNRITSSGMGESNPLAENGTSTGRQKNRRVDFQFIY
ncbi:MAG: OmpA family protein [Bacteroidota bacterium]